MGQLRFIALKVTSGHHDQHLFTAELLNQIHDATKGMEIERI